MVYPLIIYVLVIAVSLLVPSFAFSRSSSRPIISHSRLRYATGITTSTVIDARSSLLSLLIDRRGVAEDGTKNQQVRIIKECVAVLELAQSRDVLVFPALWAQLDGDWTLKYSNNVGTTIQSMAGLVLGPNNAMLTNPMLTVLQRINSNDNEIDHVLQLPNGSTITLKHDVAVTSDSSPAQLAIDLKEILLDGKLIKNQTIKLPGPSFLRRGFFDVSIVIFRSVTHTLSPRLPTTSLFLFAYVITLCEQVTYVDESLRVSRGPFGELRVFTR